MPTTRRAYDTPSAATSTTLPRPFTRGRDVTRRLRPSRSRCRSISAFSASWTGPSSRMRCGESSSRPSTPTGFVYAPQRDQAVHAGLDDEARHRRHCDGRPRRRPSIHDARLPDRPGDAPECSRATSSSSRAEIRIFRVGSSLMARSRSRTRTIRTTRTRTRAPFPAIRCRC